MKGKLIIGLILTICRKVIFWMFLVLVLTFTAVILLLQTIPFQNYITNKLLQEINQQTDQQTSIRKIKIRWFDSIELSDVEVLDYNSQTLFEAELVHLDYDLFQMLTNGNLQLNQLELGRAQLNLVNYKDSLGINLIEFIADLNNQLQFKSEPKPKKKGGSLALDYLYLHDFTFNFQNFNSDSLPSGKFDFSHFSFFIPESTMNDFTLSGDTIAVEITSLSGKDENSGLQINELSSKVEISNRMLLLDRLQLFTSNSEIRDHVQLEFTGLNDLSYFADSVIMDIQLFNSYIHPSDIQYFADVSDALTPITFSGLITGTVGDLSVRDMVVRLTNETHVSGRVDLMGLPVIEETFIDMVVSKGQIRARDMERFVPNFPENISELGLLSVEGRFSGFITDFVAKATITTQTSKLISDLNLKFPSGWQKASYSGKLTVTNFNAGAFFRDKERLQKTNFSGFIKGKGLTLDNANFYTQAELTNTGIYGYNYKSIKASGTFSKKFFDGTLVVNDPNLRLQSTGSVDLTKRPEKVSVIANVEKINFRELGLSKTDLSVRSLIDFNLTGFNLDSLNSEAKIRDLLVNYEGDSLSMDSVFLSTNNEGSGRTIKFQFPEISGSVKGNFFYSQVIKDVGLIAEEVVDYFGVLKDGGNVAFSENTFEPYRVDFAVDYGDLSDYLRFFDKELFVSKNGRIEGSYHQKRNAMLSLYTFVDSLNYNGMGFSGNLFEMNVIKDLDTLGIMAFANISSERQSWIKVPPSSNLSIEAVWQDNELTLYSNIQQKETDSKASLNGKLDFKDNRLTFKFLPSNIQVLGDRWHFNPYNRVEYNGKQFKIEQLELYQNVQTILLTGEYSDSLATNLNLKFKDFSLENLNTILPVETKGTLNGNLQVDRSSIGAPFHLVSDVNVAELMVDDYQVGDLTGISRWEAQDSRLMLDFDITRAAINTIDLNGYYYPDLGHNQLDLELNFEQANLSLLSSLFENSISELEGYADGKITISGNPNYPLLNGVTTVGNGKLTYDYLGVTYLFGGDVTFDNGSINLERIELTDKDNNKALVKGTINHEGFKNIRPKVNISTGNFLFLNTPSTNGELYYGTAYASGNVSISGSLDDLLIKTKVKSEKGTKIYIPLQDDNTVEQMEYISFRSFSDTTRTFNVQDVIKRSVSGVSLDFDMELTSDAYIELIFDLRAGDIIRGSASGNLNLILDTDGSFELFGDVSITEGAYNFTSSIKGKTLLSKEFKIQPGGTITWFGDPYAGILNLEAVYRQFASLDDYRGTQDTQTGAVATRIPILVVLALDGEMLSPTIGFEIQLDDSQSLASNADKADIDALNNNEQELKRQVFSLLMLRKFSPKNEITIAGGGITSISEFLTNQLSYYASQFNENLEIDLDLASMDQNAFNNLQLRLSYTFLDGRLRVSGGGGFNQTTTEADASGSSSFVGDWTVRYLLTSDGRLRINAFSQADQVAGVLQRETGVSLQLIKSFDDLKELVPKAREEALKKKEAQSKKAEPENSTL